MVLGRKSPTISSEFGQLVPDSTHSTVDAVSSAIYPKGWKQKKNWERNFRMSTVRVIATYSSFLTVRNEGRFSSINFASDKSHWLSSTDKREKRVSFQENHKC